MLSARMCNAPNWLHSNHGYVAPVLQPIHHGFHEFCHMIDTIQFTSTIPLQIDLDQLTSFQQRFPKIQNGERFTSTSTYSYHTRIWTFPMIDVRLVSTRSSAITKIECDLPKLLYGHNGRLIHNQAELDEAIRRLVAILRHFVLPPLHSDGLEFPIDLGPISRLDLVWQYDLPVTTIRNVLQNAKVDVINKKPNIYEGRNIVFAGTNLGVKAYDKLKECGGTLSPPSATNACRFEFKITGVERIAEHFGIKAGGGLTQLRFDQAYAVYRTLMGRINNITPSNSSSIGGIAGFLAAESLRDPWIIHRYIEYRGLHSSWASTLRQSVRGETKKLQQFSLSSLTPPAQPPQAVDVICQKKEQEFQDFLLQNPDLF